MKYQCLNSNKWKSRLVFNGCFKTFDISQGSVATYLTCGGIFSDSIITKISPDSDSENSLKIGQYLTKLRSKKVCQFFLRQPVYGSGSIKFSG